MSPNDPNRREISVNQDGFTESTGSNAQNVNFTDLICEGPIRGLVGGSGGVFFDDVAVEEAALTEFSPPPSSTSDNGAAGEITFTGSGASSVGTVNDAVDISGLTLVSGSPRTIRLRYARTTATLTSVGTFTDAEGTEIFTKFIFEAESGTPFNSGWNTSTSTNQLNNKARAQVTFSHPDLDMALSGRFTITDGDTAALETYVGEDPSIFPTTGVYELTLYYTLNIEAFDSDNNQITVTGTPAAGTYPFRINAQVFYSDPGGDVAPQNVNAVGRINGFHVDFKNGSLYQPVTRSIGGVGGAVQVAGTTSGINLTELKMIDQSTANSLGFTLYDINGLPNVDGSKTVPGNPDTSVLAAAATVIPSSSFGLDTAAKVVEADEIGFTIRYTALQVINQENGDREPAYAKYVMEMRFKQNGTFTDYTPLFLGGQVGHSGDTNAPISFEHVINLQGYRELVGPFEDFEVRISRVTRHIGLPVRWDGTSQGLGNKQKWVLNAKASIESLRSVIKDNLKYPYSAVASVSFSSRERASTPKRSYLLEGKMVKIPTTYIPREYSFSGKAKYEKFWDGTFRDELFYTDNPAWVFYDLITNNRYGAGRWIKESDVDKFALYRIARYCDELVDDGKEYDSTSTLKKGEFYKIHTVGTTDFTTIGSDDNNVGTIFRATDTSITGTGVAYGVEPRFRANVFLTKATDVYKVLKDFATIFLGILYWQDSKLTPVNEAPQDPIYNFTKGNVINGEFNYESSGSRTRVNQVIVTWHDPASNYEPVPLLVEDRESIIRTGRIISQPAVAFGATSEGQAIRYGRWKLWTAQNQTEVVNFKTSLAAHYIKPGDIINVQDADRYGIAYSGRTSSATSTTLTFDRSVSFNSGSTYELSTIVNGVAAVNLSRDSITIQDDQNPANSYTYASGSKVTAAWVWSDTNSDGTRDDYVYTTLDTEEKASNAFADSEGNEVLSLGWKPYTYTESHEITNPGTSATTVTLANSATFDTTPSAHNIWALKEISGALNTNASKKMYKVLSVGQDEPNIFSVNAVEHYNEKYTAVEEEYELGYVADTIYNDTPPATIAAPRNLRITLATDASRVGEEFAFEWDDPETDRDEILRYEVVHSIPKTQSPIITTKNSVDFEKVVNGSVLLKVRAISRSGVPSRYEALNYVVNDPYGTNIDRINYGIPKGAITNSDSGITGSSGSEAFTFAKTSPKLASNGAKEVILTPDENSQDISDISADENYYIFLDADTPTLKLMYYDTESLDNMPFWRDVGTGNSASSTSWTSIGSILIGANDNTVFGTGFNTNVQLRDILNLSGSTTASNPPGEGATVISIVSDTELKIDKTFDSQIATTGYRANYRPDFEQDAALARVHKDSSNVFTVESFLTLDPSLGGTKSAILDVDVGTLTYDSAGTQINAASSINATVSSVGFQEPEFKIVIPTGLSEAGTQDFAVSTETDTLQKTFVLDDDGAVAYNSGTALTVSASVREKNDPDTVKTTQFVITKIAEGPTGDPGPSGPSGPSGPAGPSGPGGPVGPTGGAGPTGPGGAPGPTGPDGPTGNVGPTGPGGAPGPTGPDGLTGIAGPTGPQGTIGPAGPTGISGTIGPTGPQGTIGPAGPTGVAGTIGPTGPQGTIGPQGLTGPQGTIGPSGPGGPVGPTGAQGITGGAGPTGPQGTIGQPGPTGAPGLTGPQGVQGTVGPTGVRGTIGPAGPTGAPGLTGPQGTIGAPGPTGPDSTVPGPTGPNGPTGAPGPSGPASTVPGPTGPDGPTGAPGPSGPQGQTGAVGPTGADGVTGFTGPQGPIGTVGPQGPQGTVGPTGPQGTVGPQGPTGNVGLTGPQGPQGTVGPQGPTGIIGNTGPQGPQGTVGPQGPTGNVGLTGPQGPQGTIGPVGPTGIIGNTGPQGPQGTIGPVGPTGNIGNTGPQGPQGTIGPAGPTGNVGITGPDGSPGADAPYVVIGFDSDVDTNAERVAAIKSFSGLTTVLANSVYWDAVDGIAYQNRGSDSSNPTLTALSGSNGVVNMDSIKLETGNDRVELSSSGMKIYADVSGSSVLRVKIGDLS